MLTLIHIRLLKLNTDEIQGEENRQPRNNEPQDNRIKTISIHQIVMQDKLKSFLNSLTWGEALELYKFLRTKKWQTWIDTIIHNQKID